MGKKKNKNKVSGAVKTAAKTEKKLASKLKKELANLGEEDIAKVVAQIEREEARRAAAVEKALSGPPSPRAYATLTPHPVNNELILFGGEYHNGQKTEVYNELLFYNPVNNSWKLVKAPGAPPPRSAHQTIATPANKGELWVFGGEFTSPSETQFYHYKDLWCFSLAEKKWEKVVAPNGPSPRSGHRMVLLGRRLIVFGGYSDDGRECRYFDDVHSFCLDTRTWHKLAPNGRGPSARSACVMVPAGNDSGMVASEQTVHLMLNDPVAHGHTQLLRVACALPALEMDKTEYWLIVYGGFSRVRDGRTERTNTHTDMFRLACKGEGWAWRALGGGGREARAGVAAAVNAHANKAYVFGGVSDVEETEEELRGEMSDELSLLDLESGRWHNVTLRVEQQSSAPAPAQEKADEVPVEQVTVIEDGVFTVKLGGASAIPVQGPKDDQRVQAKAKGGPTARMSAMMAAHRTVLYVYGGVLERDDKQFYLSDMYSLDLHKLNDWKTLIEQPPLPDWLGSDSEEYSGSDDESSDESSENESDE